MNIPVSHFPSSGAPEIVRPKLLIVGDSAVGRSALAQIVRQHGELEVAQNLPHIDAALAYLRDHKADVILIDHVMPGQTALDDLPALVEAAMGARIAVLSSTCREGSADALRALALGASDVFSKPSIRDYDAAFGDILIKRLMLLAAPHSPVRPPRPVTRLRPVPDDFRLECLGIGASTGGIQAIADLLSDIRVRLGVPIMITQHLPADFIPYFAMQLARATTLRIIVATDGQLLRPDHVYIAPGDANMLCVRKGARVYARLRPEKDAPLDPLPAVNPMFDSMADSYGTGAAALVLTGMGRDGMAGARRIVQAGGVVVAQDAESSTVWGMPGHIARAGLASALLPPGAMIGYVASLAELA